MFVKYLAPANDTGLSFSQASVTRLKNKSEGKITKDKTKAILTQWNLSVRAFSCYKQLHSRQQCLNNQNSDLHTVEHKQHLGLYWE